MVLATGIVAPWESKMLGQQECVKKYPYNIHIYVNKVKTHLLFLFRRWTKIVKLELSKKFDFIETWSYITKLHDPNKGRTGLPGSEFWMVWKCYGIPCFHFYFFCLEPTVTKTLWSAILKVTWSQLCLNFIFKNCEAHLQ